MTSGAGDQASVVIAAPAGVQLRRRLHQRYLDKNPSGYRCHANTGVRFPQTA